MFVGLNIGADIHQLLADALQYFGGANTDIHLSIVVLQFASDGINTRDFQFVANIAYALDETDILGGVVTVVVPVFAWVELLKLLLPIA